MNHEAIALADQAMSEAFAALETALSRVRTGRAHPGILAVVTVMAYGVPTPLPQVASVTVEDVKTLAISAWDKSLTPAIEKGILQADLGLNPQSNGGVIRVTMPALTTERRQDLIKVVRNDAENGRISLRNARRDAISMLKQELKDKALSEDDCRRFEGQVDDLTKRYVEKVDAALAQKEQDLIKV